MNRLTSETKSAGSNVRELFPRRLRRHSVSVMDWDVALVHFVGYQRARGFRPRTIENRETTVRRLQRVCGKQLLDVTLEDLTRMQGRGIAPASMQTERSDLRAFFGYLADHEHIPADPSAKLPKVKVERGKPRPYSVRQIELMLGAGAYRRTRVMILLGYLHGLRAHEIAKVHARDLDLDAGTLRILGKGGKERVIPIHELLRSEIPNMPADGYWFPSRKTNSKPHIHARSVSDLMSAAKIRAGINDERLTGHSLRHAYGTQLMWTTDMRTAQELLGHASLSSTQIYTAVDEDRKIAAVAALPTPALPVHAGRRRAA